MRTNIKKIFAVLLTVALVAAMFVMPANATKTYGDYLASSVPNGDFELGAEGMAPYGWKFLAATNAARLNANPNTWYLDGSWSFTTVVEDGNKVAKMHKLGAGYYYMGSQPADVVGGKDYYITFDYKLTDIDIPEGMIFTDQYMGIIVSVRQYNANGELLDESGNVYDESSTSITAAEFVHRIFTSAKAEGIGAEGEDDTYKTVTTKFTTAANAKTVELYIGTGAYNAKYKFSVHFDNVSLDLKEKSVYAVSNVYDAYNGNFNSSVAATYDVFNGDFEHIIHVADGSRTSIKPGPAGWYSVGANGGGSSLVSQHSNAGATTYQVITETEVDANGKLNAYAVFSLKHSYMNSFENATTADPSNVAGKNLGDTKYYNYIHSNMMKFPVAVGQTFTIRYRLKTKTADGSDTIVHGTQAKPTFMVLMFDKDGKQIAPTTNVTRFSNNIDIQPGEWAEYSLNVKVPEASKGAVYYTIGVQQSVARPQGISADAVNALYCIDDIVVDCVKPELTEADICEKYGYEEQSVQQSGWANTNSWDGNFQIKLVDDPVRGKVDMIAPNDVYKTTATKAVVGYYLCWNPTLIPVTAGSNLKVAFDFKADGIAEAIAFNKEYREANGATPEGAMGLEGRIRLRYYDAAGNIIYALNDGTVLTSDGAVAFVQAGKGYGQTVDCDWTHIVKSGVTAPANAVYVQYGYQMYGYNRPGSGLVEHYFDNVIIKSDNDAYWTSAEYAMYANGEINDTNLFDKVILSNGNGLTTDDETALINLVKMNNTITSTKKAPYASGDASAVYDMNDDGRITDDDIIYYRWKLLGITDESKVVK